MKNIYQEMIHHAPFGYAHHEVILNNKGEVVDYIFLDINAAFENMTGLKKEDILQKKVTQVLPSISDDNFDWVAFYGTIAINGGNEEFTAYSEPLNKWYKITAFSTKKGYFTTFVQNVTQEKEEIIDLKNKTINFEKTSNELETIFNSTQDAMFLVRIDDKEVRYIRNNSIHQKSTGYSLEDFKEKSPVELFGKNMGTNIESDYMQCALTGQSMTYERTLQFPRGEKIWLTSLNPVFDEGVVKYIVGSSKDITIQKKRERENIDLLERFKAMFEGHTAVMLLIDSESGNGRIIDANPSALSFYGYSRKEILKLNISDINILAQSEVEKIISKALNNNQAYYLFPHRLKSGEIRFVDVYTSPIMINGKKLRYSIICDVTDREEYKMKLFQDKELLRTTLLSIGDGVVSTDKNGIITSMNKVAEQITGWTEEEAISMEFSRVFKLVSEATERAIENPIAKVLRTGKIIGLANHTSLINKKGEMIPIADSAAPIMDEKGEIFGVVMVLRDVTKEKEQMDRIMYLSFYDTLTGLHNRGFMEEELKRLDTSRDVPCAVILGDLNGLKIVNDVFGHLEGDRLLRRASEIITESCRKEDIIARWGGDEFLIVLPRTNAEIAEEIVSRIQTKCSQYHGEGPQVSIALGYALKEEVSENLMEIIKIAEEQMYRRKLLEGKSFRNSIIGTMITTLYAKSVETKEHADRLIEYCLAVAKELKLSLKELDELTLLAVLHDIGKIAINENILKKPGPLTDEEWVEMKKHPEIGYRIAQNISELASVAEYILHHHERWDGKGYPQGLKGKEIPINCRILAVVDAFDAMTNDRCYRKAIEIKEAVEELIRNRGKQFDATVVDIFLKQIENSSK